ncbi:MAG: aminoacyl-tRNA hydrolase [Ignavibacteriaceae bacterium]
MRLIVGIGNPGIRYRNNRHNVGYQFLDYYAEKKLLKFKASRFNYYYAEGELYKIPFFLLKPNSYVNNSGIAVLAAVQELGIYFSELLIIVDDIHIPTGEIRIRKSGGDGGHNGLKSIIYHLNSDDFPRLRIGIGKNFASGKLPDYVLSDFDDKDLIELKKTFDVSITLVDGFIKAGFQEMLNSYSRLKKIEN